MVFVKSLDNIDTLVLCGGLGKRLRKKIGPSQKVLALVGDRPFLDTLLNYLQAQGLKRVILATGYKGGKVESYYKKNKTGLSLYFSREEKPLGTGGAVKHAKKFLKSNPFFVLNGDSLCALDLIKFLRFHFRKKSLASIAISRVKDARDYGTIAIDGHKRIRAFKEKIEEGKRGFVNAGMYWFDKKILRILPKKKKFSLERDVFPQLIEKGFFGFETKTTFFDIGTPKRYENAQRYFRKRRHHGKIPL